MDELDDVGAALGVCACEGDTDCVRLPLPVGLPVSVRVDVSVWLGLEVELAVAACDADWVMAWLGVRVALDVVEPLGEEVVVLVTSWLPVLELLEDGF